MTTHFSYDIQQLITEDLDGQTHIVRAIIYGARATLVENTEITVVQSERIALDLPDSSSFTEFDQLTESQVKTWLMAALTEQDQARHQANLSSLIETQIAQAARNTQLISQLPWQEPDPNVQPTAKLYSHNVERIEVDFTPPKPVVLLPDGTTQEVDLD